MARRSAHLRRLSRLLRQKHFFGSDSGRVDLVGVLERGHCLAQRAFDLLIILALERYAKKRQLFLIVSHGSGLSRSIKIMLFSVLSRSSLALRSSS